MQLQGTIERIRTATEPIVNLFPHYHADAADMYEALDTGTASCAVRAFAATLLLGVEFPNRKLYQIDFGYAPEHGSDYVSSSGENCLLMGHCAARLWIPGYSPLVVDSFGDASLEAGEVPAEYEDFTWGVPALVYSDYLHKAQLEYRVDEFDILVAIYRKLAPTPSRLMLDSRASTRLL
jgi:hypothetical protein